MKMGETMETAYLMIDGTTIGRTLEKLYGDTPDAWMICNELSVTKDGVRYSKVQTTHKGKSIITWFRHPSIITLNK